MPNVMACQEEGLGPWQTLPDSLLLDIFNYFPCHLLLRAAKVCKTWHRVAFDEYLWKNEFYRFWGIDRSISKALGKESWHSEFKRLYLHTPKMESETLKEHRDQVLHVSFSHNGEMFATSSKDGFVKVWHAGFPARVKYYADMKEFTWKYTQYSQFNESDTLLLVSGVHFGSHSTSGEIAVFSLVDGFELQCRVLNKPYDIFGTWYNDQYLLSGNLHWLGHLTSASVLWLNKASQALESERENVVMRLYKFRNINASSIRTIMIASCLDDPRKDQAGLESRKRKGSESEETTLSGIETSHTECKQGKARRRGNKGKGFQKMQFYSDEQNHIHLLEVDNDASDVGHTIEYNIDYRLAESTCHEMAQSQVTVDGETVATPEPSAASDGSKLLTEGCPTSSASSTGPCTLRTSKSLPHPVPSGASPPSPPRPATLPSRHVPLRTHDTIMFRDASTSTEPDMTDQSSPRSPSGSGSDEGALKAKEQGQPRALSRYLDLDDDPEDSDFESEEEEEMTKYEYLQRHLRESSSAPDLATLGIHPSSRMGGPNPQASSSYSGFASGSNTFFEAPSGDKYLIFTTGMKTYTPHQIGIKRIKYPETLDKMKQPTNPSPPMSEVKTENNPPGPPADEFDTVDHLIELHGHIIGMCLSPDQRYLYVNSRPWPQGYEIEDPLYPPPIAQEIDIHVIDLLTMHEVGTMHRAHKAYTPNDECFFIFLDVCDEYVASGAEDKHGYLWDRHYGVCLTKFPHSDVVNSVAFNPKDPEMLITASDDHCLKIWRSRFREKQVKCPRQETKSPMTKIE